MNIQRGTNAGGVVARFLVVLGLSVVVATFMFPMFARGCHEHARRPSCQSNLKQVGLGLLMYAQANDGLLPPVNKWQEAAAEYLKTDQLFVCPEAGSRSLPHYLMVQSLSGARVGALPDPRNTVLIYDGVNGVAAAGPEGGVNMLYADGHVKMVMDVTPYGLTKVVAREQPWEPSLRDRLHEVWFDMTCSPGLWVLILTPVLLVLWGVVAISFKLVRRLSSHPGGGGNERLRR